MIARNTTSSKVTGTWKLVTSAPVQVLAVCVVYQALWCMLSAMLVSAGATLLLRLAGRVYSADERWLVA